MIQTKNLLSTIAICGAVSLAGCTLPKMVKMAKDQQLTVTPSPLEVHADQVKFDMSAALPAKMLKKKTTYTADIDYKYGDKKTDVGEIVYNAADYPNAKKEQPKAEKSFTFPYTEGMERGNLVVTGTAAKGKKSKTTPEMVAAPGIITTSKLVKDANMVAFAETGYNPNPEFEPTDVAFFFPQGSAQLRSTETRSKRGKFLDAFIAEKNVTKTVTVTGTHSPEGAERINSRLSENRAQAIEKYYRGKMKAYQYKTAADSIEFVLKPVIEDWQMLKDTLAATDIIEEDQKQQILSIIDGSGDFEQKEDQLHSLPSYRKLLGQVYPKLRTAQTEILTLMEKKPASELSALARQMAEGRGDTALLKNNELAYAATLTPDLNEKRAIYEA
jgi:outer membrane protein OmpA-like peptidoglycan-associated protein